MRYTSDTSKYMYLMRFLDVTLDTYQDTSRYIKYVSDRKSPPKTIGNPPRPGGGATLLWSGRGENFLR